MPEIADGSLFDDIKKREFVVDPKTEPTTPTPKPKSTPPTQKSDVDDPVSEDMTKPEPFPDIPRKTVTIPEEKRRRKTPGQSKFKPKEWYADKSYAQVLMMSLQNYGPSWKRAVSDSAGAIARPIQTANMMRAVGGDFIKAYAAQWKPYILGPIRAMKGQEWYQDDYNVDTPALNAILNFYAESYSMADSQAGFKKYLAEDPVGMMGDVITLASIFYSPALGLVTKSNIPVGVLSKLNLYKKLPKPMQNKWIEAATKTAAYTAVDPAGGVGHLGGRAIATGYSKLPFVSKHFKTTEFGAVAKQQEIINELAGKYSTQSSPVTIGRKLTKAYDETVRVQFNTLLKNIKELRAQHSIQLKGGLIEVPSLLEKERLKRSRLQVSNPIYDDFLDKTRNLDDVPRNVEDILTDFGNVILHIEKNPAIRQYIDVDTLQKAFRDDIRFIMTEELTPLFGLDMAGTMADDLAYNLDEVLDFKYGILRELMVKNRDTPEKIVPLLVKNTTTDVDDVRKVVETATMNNEDKVIFQAEVVKEIFEMSPEHWTPNGLANTIEGIGKEKVQALLDPEVYERLQEFAEYSKKFKNTKSVLTHLDTLIGRWPMIGAGTMSSVASGNWNWFIGSMIGTGGLEVLNHFRDGRSRFILRTPANWAWLNRTGKGVVKTRYAHQRAERKKEESAAQQLGRVSPSHIIPPYDPNRFGGSIIPKVQ